MPLNIRNTNTFEDKFLFFTCDFITVSTTISEQERMNFLQLSNLVPDKASSVQFLQQQGLHQVRRCQTGHNMVLQLRNNGDRWRCRIRGCRCEIGLRKDTWFEGSRVPFRQIILFIYSWSREYGSGNCIEHEIGLNKGTTVDFNMYLREICAMDLLANPILIGGPNTVVEVDESLFSRRKNQQGRVLPQWVFGGICRQTGECFMYTVPDRSAATLLPIILQASIRPGTTIMSDMWRAYGGMLLWASSI